MTFVRFLATVNSAVPNKACWSYELSAANVTFKRFLSRMTSSVSCKVVSTLTTFATFCALLFTRMQIHVVTQGDLRWTSLITLGTWIHVLSSVAFLVSFWTLFSCKPFLTHCTHIRPWQPWLHWLIIVWILSEIFNFDLKRTPKHYK